MPYLELPDLVVDAEGRRWRARPDRLYVSLEFTADANGNAEATVNPVIDFVADYYTGYSNNANGLDSFRFHVENVEKGTKVELLKQDIDTDPVSPRASLVMTSANGLRNARPVLRVFRRDVKLKFKVTEATNGDKIDVTLHVRELVPA